MLEPPCFGTYSAANVICSVCESVAACKIRTAQIAAEPETLTDGDEPDE